MVDGEDSAAQLQSERGGIDQAIGTALKSIRVQRGLSARELASRASVSAAMISRIESGGVSPSISTLSAIAEALDVPLVSLFRETASQRVDFTLVRKGEGLRSTRIVGEYAHEFVNLALHARRDLQFEARRVTVARQTARPPIYLGHGVVFVHILSGEAIYRYGPNEFLLKAGDSLTIDAELSHGFREVRSEVLEFLTVQAERR